MTVPRKAPRKQAGTTEPPRPVPCIFSIYLYDAEPPANEPDARALSAGTLAASGRWYRPTLPELWPGFGGVAMISTPNGTTQSPTLESTPASYTPEASTASRASGSCGPTSTMKTAWI